MLTEQQIADLHLKDEILPALRAALPTMRIEDIYLRGDEDHDGDPILRVYINFSGAIPTNIIARTVIITRIMEILEKHNIDAFPSPTFMREKDFRDNIGDKFYAIA